jgi:hypothetical protein
LREREDRGVSAYTQSREEEQLVLEMSQMSRPAGGQKNPVLSFSGNKHRPSAISNVLLGSGLMTTSLDRFGQ